MRNELYYYLDLAQVLWPLVSCLKSMIRRQRRLFYTAPLQEIVVTSTELKKSSIRIILFCHKLKKNHRYQRSWHLHSEPQIYNLILQLSLKQKQQTIDVKKLFYACNVFNKKIMGFLMFFIF